MARAENFNKIMKRDKTGCLERMKLSSCVNFPRVFASSGEATAFPRGTSGASMCTLYIRSVLPDLGETVK